MVKIILAWDAFGFEGYDKVVLEELRPYIDMVKVGGIATTTRLANGNLVADEIRAFAHDNLDLPVMWDSKIHDIADTAKGAAENIVADRVHMLTFHTTMSDAAIQGVISACEQGGTIGLGVSVLTDLTPEECALRFNASPPSLLHLLVKNAKKLGMKGLVCSAQDLLSLKHGDLHEGMTVVTPGIRPAWASPDDQVRTATPLEAARAGATHLVIGRPILAPPSSMTSVDAVLRIKEELAAA